MRDLTRTGFDSNSPLRNYVKLSERIDSLESRFKQLEQLAIDVAVRVNQEKKPFIRE